jgi:hypothetical protein
MTAWGGIQPFAGTAANGEVALFPAVALRPEPSNADLVSAAPMDGQPMVRTTRKRASPAIIFA